jgi:hypothetical protein
MMMLAADDSSDAVAVIAILVIFGGPMALWFISKVQAHKERMAMIQRGMAPPPGPGVPPPPPGWYPAPGVMPPPDYLYAQRSLRRGIQVACIGLALLIGLGTIGGSHHIMGPWLLGGLIPLFVGIAQILNAYLNGARLPIGPGQYGGPPPQNYNQPSGQQRPSAPPPAGNGPYGWRPGPTPEIERPVPPPDKR